MTKSVKSHIPNNELEFYSYSSGVSLCEGTFLGLVEDDRRKYKFIEFDCIGEQFKVVKDLSSYYTEE